MSGPGRELAVHCIWKFTNIKLVSIQEDAVAARRQPEGHSNGRFCHTT